MTSRKLVVSAAFLAGAVSAVEPANVQDPPGKVNVDQPAGVSFTERHTERDTTDTLRGGGRTDVIAGERAGSHAGPDIETAEARGYVQQGAEARASFEEASASVPRNDTVPPGRDAATDDTGGSAFLGTDIGYGTGTEPAAPTPSR